MNIIKTAIEGSSHYRAKGIGDNRGYFFESFSQLEFDAKSHPYLGNHLETDGGISILDDLLGIFNGYGIS